MKVDKAVCTTDTMTDAQSAISYENLLSTLVQKKILAIKRECEAKNLAKQKRKEKNCLGSLIFSSRHDRSSRQPDEEAVATNASIIQQTTVMRPAVMESKSKNGDNQDLNVLNVLADNQKQGNAIDTTVLLNCAQATADNKTLTKIESTKCQIDVLNEHGPGDGNDNNLRQTNDHLNGNSNTPNVNGKHGIRMFNNCYDSQNISGTHITDDAHSTQSKKSDKSVIELDIESSSTITNSKSASIVSQIEVSDEINPKYKLRIRKNSSDTISVPSSMKHTTLSAPAETMALHDQEQSHQIHLLKAKSISAQCSPVLAQRQTFTGTYPHTFIYIASFFFFWLVTIIATFYPVSLPHPLSRVFL